MKALVPNNEAERLEALRRYSILDTPPEPDFDDMALMAAQICATPIAMVSLVDADRHWFKAKVGMTATQIPRDIGFCNHAILQPDLFMIPDAMVDERFSSNPLVTGPPYIRFYVGAPLIASDGQALGTLCVIDRVPRQLTPEQIKALRALSRQVVAQLELRKAITALSSVSTESKEATEALRTSEEFKTRLIECSRDCIKVLDLDGRLLSMNAGGMAILEICDISPFLKTSWIEFWQGEDREKARAAVEAARSGGVGRFIGFFPTTVTKKPLWWDVIVNPIKDAQDRPEKLLALSRDITDLKNAEDMLRDITEETASVIGSDFFHMLAEHLAKAFQIRYALIAECTDATNTRVRTLAFWNGESFNDNVTYELRGTPCEHVISGQVRSYPERVHSLFPQDKDLVNLAVEGYLGAPLYNSSGRLLGHLALMDVKPLSLQPHQIAIVKIFAARAGAELERVRAHEDIRCLNQELGALLDINRAIGRHLNRDELFGALAAGLKTLVPTEFFGIELPIEGDKLQGHILTQRLTGAEPTQPTVLPATGTVCNWVLQNRELFIAASREELRERFPITFEVMSREGMESLCALPLVSGEHSRAALFFMAAAKGAYERLHRGLLEQVASAVAVALDDCLAHEEVRTLRDRLAAENVYLQEEIKVEHHVEEIIGASTVMKKVFQNIQKVARTDTIVLITGETGTGKELVARAIHNLNSRKAHALIKVDCAVLPSGLIESELFGHERGSFTGATSRKKGRFELADGGTIFLDEVGELSLDTQTKLLRVLQEQEFERVGGTQTLKVDVRVIAATNRNLEEAVRLGAFRADLFYRLNIFPIHNPPLRERVEDIPMLIDYFIRKFSRKLGKRVDRVSPKALERLMGYNWPGNVRELANIVERAVILCDGPVIQGDQIHISEIVQEKKDEVLPLEEAERLHILKAVEKTGWVVGGPRGAATLLGMNRTTLLSRMKKLGINQKL